MPDGIARRRIVFALFISLFAGFAVIAPLRANVDSSNEGDVASAEDLIVTGFDLASSADQARYWAAMDRWHFALFPEMPLPSVLMGQYLPMLKLSVQANHQLFDLREPGPRTATLYLCGGMDPRWGLSGTVGGNTLWQGRLVDQEVSQQIEEQLNAASTPQKYEIFFTYSYWDPTAKREKENHITLLPLQDDVCLTFQDSPAYAVSSTGRILIAIELLSISKEAVNEAVGDLPRQIAVPDPRDWQTAD